MANPFSLTIVTPRSLAFQGEVTKLILRTTEGDVGILKGHANYLAAVSIGRLVVDTPSGRRFGAVNGGFVSVINGETIVSAISFEWADEIDLERAMRSREMAEKLVSSKEGKELELARNRMLRAINRIDVYQISKK